MDRLNSHFLRPSPTAPEVSGDGQSTLLDKLALADLVYSLAHIHYHPGIEQQAQGRSAETAVSPHHNYQSTVYQSSAEDGTYRKQMNCVEVQIYFEE
jgi:hypothetical protein